MVYIEFLIIRANFDLATDYTNWIGDGIKGYLESKGYTVKDLSDSAASPENVDNWLDINNEKISKVAIALDHGSNNAFYGEKNNQSAEVINPSNVARLTEDLHVYTLACSTNAPNGLGQKAIGGGCYSWLGYTEPVYAAKTQSFKDCIWSYIQAMAEGKTIEECEEALRTAYEDRDTESFIYGYNLARMLNRTLHANMKINTHYRTTTTTTTTTTTRTPPDGPKCPCKGCFIATAAYGSPAAPQVAFLRNIRDKGLRKIRMGDLFVDAYEWIYYKFSPGVAAIMDKNPHFKNFMRKVIVNPIVYTLMGIFKPLYWMRERIVNRRKP
ncbi:MAG: CFI-box-CTERM domain-containing protein [Candidatus Thorarchaeota archaeon]